jgi:poly(ADP-ribose) glycohydrolase ARH3
MEPTFDQYAGCLLGLATGDALGAPHEGGPLERLLWRMIGKTSDGCLRWTDDTQMAIDLAESLLAEGGVQQDALAQRFAAGYRWSRGYGPGAAKILKRIRHGEPWQTATKAVYAGGSYGNGAAMRAPVLALFYPCGGNALIDAAKASAMVTHSHALGIDGAILVALATWALLVGDTTLLLEAVRSGCSTPKMVERLDVVAKWVGSSYKASSREVSKTLGNGITALTSCPTALYIALIHLTSPFEAMMEFIIRCRGDVDTIGAMAGAYWGIANGAGRLPRIRLEGRDRFEDLTRRMFQRRK